MDSTLPKIQEAFSATFHVSPESVSIDTSSGDISAWDSVGHLSLAAKLEEMFGISFDVDDLMEMENVREIVRIVSSKISSKV